MRKVRDGEKKTGGKNGEKMKRQMKIVATMLLPAVNRHEGRPLECRTLVPIPPTDGHFQENIISTMTGI